MKSCCQVEPEKPNPNNYAKWLKWAVALVVVCLIIFVSISK